MNTISKNPIYDLAISYQKTAALVAAARLNIFDLIGSSSVTAQNLADRADIPLKSVFALCDFLCILGLLVKSEGKYSIAAAALAYLKPGSGSRFLDSLDFLAAPEIMSLYLNHPEKFIKNGGSAGLGVTAENDRVWEKFAEAMLPFAAPASKLVASKMKSTHHSVSRVLDVAAGHGLYGIEFAHAFPEAEITAVDWQDVLEVAKSKADQANVGDRYSTLPGSIFDVSLPEKYDVILLPNILHHFGVAACTEILGKMKGSLSENGAICIVDFMPDPETLTPPEAVAFAFQMLATTPDGSAYTVEDYCEFGSAVGLKKTSAWRLFPTPATLLVLQQRTGASSRN